MARYVAAFALVVLAVLLVSVSAADDSLSPKYEQPTALTPVATTPVLDPADGPDTGDVTDPDEASVGSPISNMQPAPELAPTSTKDASAASVVSATATAASVVAIVGYFVF